MRVEWKRKKGLMMLLFLFRLFLSLQWRRDVCVGSILSLSLSSVEFREEREDEGRERKRGRWERKEGKEPTEHQRRENDEFCSLLRSISLSLFLPLLSLLSTTRVDDYNTSTVQLKSTVFCSVFYSSTLLSLFSLSLSLSSLYFTCSLLVSLFSPSSSFSPSCLPLLQPFSSSSPTSSCIFFFLSLFLSLLFHYFLSFSFSVSLTFSFFLVSPRHECSREVKRLWKRKKRRPGKNQEEGGQTEKEGRMRDEEREANICVRQRLLCWWYSWVCLARHSQSKSRRFIIRSLFQSISKGWWMAWFLPWLMPLRWDP